MKPSIEKVIVSQSAISFPQEIVDKSVEDYVNEVCAAIFTPELTKYIDTPHQEKLLHDAISALAALHHNGMYPVSTSIDIFQHWDIPNTLLMLTRK
jgi:hypothetical protein